MIDLRLSRTIRAGRFRVQPKLDLYNVLNSNTVTGVNSVYGPQYLTVQQIMTGRFARLGAQIDF